MKIVLRKYSILLQKCGAFYRKPESLPHTRLFWLVTGFVTIAVTVFCVYFSLYLTAHHDALLTNAEDFGIIDQVLWNTLHGAPLHQTICNTISDTNCTTPTGVVRLAIHVEPILLPLSLLYAFWTNPKCLLIVQTIVVASGAYPAFWLARLRLRSEVAGACFALIYLLYPALQQALGFDFHAVAFTAALVLYLLYFLYTQQVKAVFTFAVLAMVCKEEIALVVAACGLWSAFFQWRWRSGLALTLLAVFWFIVATKVIMPAFSPVSHALLLPRYSQLGSPGALLISIVRHPFSFLNQYLWERHHLLYLAFLLAPVLFLPLLAPWIFVLALPALAVNLLSSDPQMYSGYFHYSAEIVPILIFATIEALVVLLWLLGILVNIFIEQRENVRRAAHFLTLFGLSTGMICCTLAIDRVFNGQMPFAEHYQWPVVSEHAKLAEKFIHLIPPDASVSAQNKLVSHLSERRFIYLFPYADHNAEYILLDTTGDLYPCDTICYKQAVKSVVCAGSYNVMQAQDGYVLLKRVPADSRRNLLMSRTALQSQVQTAFCD